ncbi:MULTISPECIES: hypothetical protein [unclassified Hyphomonas]|jgi:hypothetical protein|uniref:hypothetical protein n=1 Tax=unclassified Hyphomonas TaxID=2630699 RepID=UPI000458DBE1|nr:MULTISPECIES: hypothetical protein [unclassified Hyphomonas]KCZ47846.1 hypothetical protein HY17_05045 [Hyphomonas sp. CY54-11-8]
MTSRLARMTALALAGTLLATTPVHAGTEDDATDVLGTWSFRTKPYRGGECLMTGTMYLTPHPEPDQFTCELTAVEVCSVWGRSVVRQSCKARRFGDQLSIRSEIEEMLESKVEGLIYVPDNFTLTIESADRMFGALVSAVTAPAEFRRATNGIS